MGWHPLKGISVKHPARAMRCPYLGLYDNRSQALSELTSRHRCHMIAIHGNQARPERVGTSYRAQAAAGHRLATMTVLSCSSGGDDWGEG